MTRILDLVPIWVWALLAVAMWLFVQELRISWSESRLTDVTAERDDLAASAKQAAQALIVRDAVDTQYQEALTDAQADNGRLRADLAIGNHRVYVRAACVPSDPKSASRPDAATAELEADARQDYANLVGALAKQRAQVVGLQDYIAKACK